MKGIVLILLIYFATATTSFGQAAFLGLKAGISTRPEIERVFGQPAATISEVLLEYRASDGGQKVYVQYRPDGVIDRIETLFESPVSRGSVSGLLALPQKADSTKWDSKGRLEEYFGGNRLMVLTHQTAEPTSSIIRVGYYSTELFAIALEKPTGTPMKSPPPQMAPVSTRPVNKAPVKIFENVDIMIPKGDKAEEKSARLFFDGTTVVIDADNGEKIYKSFPYNTIVSAEYSYSKSPRWKTAIGAAILIGVFALPLFFMKSKKHWLTIQNSQRFRDTSFGQGQLQDDPAYGRDVYRDQGRNGRGH